MNWFGGSRRWYRFFNESSVFVALSPLFFHIPLSAADVFARLSQPTFNVHETRFVSCFTQSQSTQTANRVNILDALNFVRDFIARPDVHQNSRISCRWSESSHPESNFVYLSPLLNKRELMTTAIATASYERIPGSGVWLNGGQHLYSGITPYAELSLSEAVRYCFGAYGIFSQASPSGHYRKCAWGGVDLPIKREGDIVTIDFETNWRYFESQYPVQ